MEAFFFYELTKDNMYVCVYARTYVYTVMQNNKMMQNLSNYSFLFAIVRRRGPLRIFLNFFLQNQVDYINLTLNCRE